MYKFNTMSMIRMFAFFFAIFLSGCSTNRPVDDSPFIDNQDISQLSFTINTDAPAIGDLHDEAVLHIGCTFSQSAFTNFNFQISPVNLKNEIQLIPITALLSVDDHIAAVTTFDSENSSKLDSDNNNYYVLVDDKDMNINLYAHLRYGSILDIDLIFKDKSIKKYAVDLRTLPNEFTKFLEQCTEQTSTAREPVWELISEDTLGEMREIMPTRDEALNRILKTK